MNTDLFETHLEYDEFSKIFSYFMKNNTRFKGYKTLEDDYVHNSPKGTDLKQFKERLRIFFNSCVDEENQVEKDEDDLYPTLCKFNFDHQATWFDALVTSNKPLIPFIIRGQADYGQTWLCNKLIYQYQQKYPLYHKSIIVDLGKLNYDLELLIDQLSQKIQVVDYHKAANIAQKKARLKQTIIKKIETSSQFIILNNAYSFVHSNDNLWKMFTDFYTDFEGANSTHKCILLFVENEPAEYNREYCICSKTTSKFKAKNEAVLKFIDLHNIEEVDQSIFEDWLGSHECHDCWNELSDADIETCISACNGNPYEILNLICEKQEGNKLSNYENKWLKY